ncbi:MAG: DUF6089 family protein [Bacteroidia bacterium]|nr:DUF6089 family protein [Bacteroidia bacterium]
MKKHSTLALKVFTLSFSLLLFDLSSAQNPLPSKRETALDFGILIGGSNYMGELTKSILPVFKETHLAGGLIIRYNLSQSISLRATAMYMRISGDDKNFDSDAFRRRRNLNFRSDIFEFSGGFEWNLLGWYQSRTRLASSPYLFGSVGVYRFNPTTQFFYYAGLPNQDPSLASQNGNWIELQPLSTEAQETTKNNEQKRYALTQVCIPFGVGYKFQLSDNWTAGIEFGARKTFTDYLDDISTKYWDPIIVGGAGGYMANAVRDRSYEVGEKPFMEEDARGNKKTKDWYMFAGVHITYRILGGKVPCFNFE